MLNACAYDPPVHIYRRSNGRSTGKHTALAPSDAPPWCVYAGQMHVRTTYRSVHMHSDVPLQQGHALACALPGMKHMEKLCGRLGRDEASRSRG